ncbi:uncharacterized protein LOC106162827 [Lingula anatina]|uniref:Uncharacterized protein LOC106162827 n=1 Tax=Lingula anatina TaxID=7574 RepID=A0A1S3ICW9_LINAN|nr:uncharacterized protein LOC106162827 [Lingula anatina]|eukprot:XP_013395706.1 uncharacterized protein LOC106162827 [Lingula anatina]
MCFTMGSVLPVVFMCITALIFTGKEAESYPCTKPQFNVEDSSYCYEKIKVQRAYSNATNYCSANGGGLIEITSQVINQAVLNGMEVNKYYWIGGTKDEKGNWYWPEAGYQWNFSALSDARSNSKCLYISKSNTAGNGWFTDSCDKKHGYICQYKMDSATSSATTESSTTKQTSHPLLNTSSSITVKQSLTTSASKPLSSSLSPQITSTGVSSQNTKEITHKTTNQQQGEIHSTVHIETTTKQPIGKQTTTQLSLTNKTDIDSLIAELARQCEAERKRQQQEVNVRTIGFSVALAISFTINVGLSFRIYCLRRKKKDEHKEKGGHEEDQIAEFKFNGEVS